MQALRSLSRRCIRPVARGGDHGHGAESLEGKVNLIPPYSYETGWLGNCSAKGAQEGRAHRACYFRFLGNFGFRD